MYVFTTCITGCIKPQRCRVYHVKTLMVHAADGTFVTTNENDNIFSDFFPELNLDHLDF